MPIDSSQTSRTSSQPTMNDESQREAQIFLWRFPPPCQYAIWDSLNTSLADDERYSPSSPGVYTWPLHGEKGFYRTLQAGPLPPIKCEDTSHVAGLEHQGCFADDTLSELPHDNKMMMMMIQREMVLPKGPMGMTVEVSSRVMIMFV